MRAGADPSKSICFIHPEYGDRNPKSIAILGVYDRREEKKNSEELVRDLAKSFGSLLITKKRRGLRAPEVRKKLLSDGVPEAVVSEPPVKTACEHLGVGSVFHAELFGYKKTNYIIGQATAYAIRTAITECKSGELLYKVEEAVSENRGFLLAPFMTNRKLVAAYALGDLPWPEARSPSPATAKPDDGQNSGITGKIKSVKKVTKVVPHW